MSKTTRVGIIGTGGISRAHMNGIKDIPGVEVVALADLKPEITGKFKADFKLGDNVKEYIGWQKLVAAGGLDAVSICTPNGVHCAPAVAALKAGMHVICEKPLAMNAKEGKMMCDAAKASGKTLTIGFQQRFRPDVQYVAKLVKDGVLGDIVYCRTQYLRRRGIPSWGVFGNKKLNGGGPMIDIGVHALDMAHYICGRPAPLTATGACHTYIGNRKPDTTAPWGEWDWKTYTVEDLATGYIRFKGGLSMVIESSFAAHVPETESLAIQVMGTKGGAMIGSAMGSAVGGMAGAGGVRVFTDFHGKMINMQTPWLPGDDCFKVKIQNWIAVCRGEMENDAPGTDGLMVQRLLDGVYNSAEKGRELDISK